MASSLKTSMQLTRINDNGTMCAGEAPKDSLAEPMRPRGSIVLTMAPGFKRIVAQAMNEFDIGLSLRLLTTGDWVQNTHCSGSSRSSILA